LSQDKVKGKTHRLLSTPGYHLHPQYDLHHTRWLVEERKHKKRGFSLSLAPMVDMFSILVIYLIMNFSTTGEVFFVSKDIVIPKASKGNVMQSFPLLSVVGGTVMFETEESPGQMGIYIEEINDGQVPKLRETLKQLKKIELQISGSDKFKGQINLQADENAPIEDVKKVMRVLVDEGWAAINFLVEPNKK
jgi:biopolymer transport protein ExbD